MIIFFVRGYNDVDHIVPIVWKMRSEGKNVSLFCLTPDFDLYNDYRIKFLIKYGVPVRYIFEEKILVAGLLNKFIALIIRNIFPVSHFLEHLGLNFFSRKTIGIGRRGFSLLMKTSFKDEAIDYFIVKNSVKILCFDWVRPEVSIVSKLLFSATRLGRPSIALPHGVNLCTNDDIAWNIDPKKSVGWRNSISDSFSKVVVQYPFFHRYLDKNDQGIEKVLVLGSARYCDEWIEKNIAISPRALSGEICDDQRLKCAFMATRIQYKVDVDQMKSMFKRLSEIEESKVVIKPHTRSIQENKLYYDTNLDDVSNISSVELCQWADVILVIASSVMIEALQQGKVVLYLKYLHSNRTLHEEYKDCWVIESEDELVEALFRLNNDINDVPYQSENTNNFLLDVTMGGVPKRDVLGDYSLAISELTK